MAAPDQAISDKLSSISGLAQSTATQGRPPVAGNLYLGPERRPEAGTARDAVFVLSSGGDSDGPFLGVATEHKTYAVTIFVRWLEYEAGLTMARACMDAVDYQAIAGYLSCNAVPADPVYSGIDDEMLHHWSIPLELQYIGT